MHVLCFGNKLKEEVCCGFTFANLFSSLYLKVRLWWSILVASLVPNFQDLVTREKNLVAKEKNLFSLAPVLGAISCPASVMCCSLMVGATSSEFRPVLSLGRLTVKCRVHPELINSCSCSAASWLTTLLSTCITTNNFCMRRIHKPDSVLLFLVFYSNNKHLGEVPSTMNMLPHYKERLSALANSYSISFNFRLCYQHFHYLPATHSPFNGDYFPLHFIVLVLVI